MADASNIEGKGAVKPNSGGAEKKDETPALSKAELKRLRREKQEAQRAAKSGAKQGASKQSDTANTEVKVQPAKRPSREENKNDIKVTEKVKPNVEKVKANVEKPKKAESSSSKMRVPDQLCADVKKSSKRLEKRLQKQNVQQRQTAKRIVPLFSHLPQFVKEQALTEKYLFNTTGIHPAILALGVQYARGIICGSNARCVALLSAFSQVIRDYSTPNHKDLARDLEAKLKPNISFLSQCRPLSVSMGNAIKYIKCQITQVPSDQPEKEAKEHLQEVIRNFVQEKIFLAAEVISKDFTSKKKILDGDVILIHGYSSLIKSVLCNANNEGIKFRVIVADSRPKLEGIEMLRQLLNVGIECSYIYITAISYVMQEVSKVLLGAHALLSNGFVMSRVGTSQVALIARAYNVPVIVCCETYKFSDNVQTDSFVFNELGDPNDLVSTKKSQDYLSKWEDLTSLNLLNLVYDVTPPDLVTAVVTEIGMIPCTSVPVVLRVKSTGGAHD